MVDQTKFIHHDLGLWNGNHIELGENEHDTRGHSQNGHERAPEKGNSHSEIEFRLVFVACVEA